MELASVISKLTRRLHAKVNPTPAIERRLTWRVHNYWDGKRRDKPFPCLADIAARDIPDLWPWCFIIDVKLSVDYTHFHELGGEIAKYSGIFLSGERDWASTLLDRAGTNLPDVVARREPLIFEDELTRFDQRTILLRGVLLPLSDEGSAINYVLGAVNGKLVENLT